MNAIEEPLASLIHRTNCVEGLHEHVAPIGFDEDEPTWAGYHGESARQDAQSEQCMCGHPMYLSCPDWLAVWQPTTACQSGRHDECDRTGFNTYVFGTQSNSCACDCHDLPLSEVIVNATKGAAQ